MSRRASREENAVVAARTAVEDERSRLAGIETQVRAAESDLARLDSAAGLAALESPAEIDRIAAELHTARLKIEIAGRAVEAQLPRVTEAEAQYLRAEADLITVRDLIPAREALLAHETRTAELLAALDEHEGGYVPEYLYQRTINRDSLQPSSVRMPRSFALKTPIEVADAQVDVLTALAEGRRPGVPLDQYPECLRGPGSLIQTEAMLSSIANARQRISALEEETIPDLRRRAADAHAVVEEAREAGDVAQARPGRPGFGPTLADKAVNLDRSVKQAEQQLAAARQDLARLIGDNVVELAG